jgi:hypothetical protein
MTVLDSRRHLALRRKMTAVLCLMFSGFAVSAWRSSPAHSAPPRTFAAERPSRSVWPTLDGIEEVDESAPADRVGQVGWRTFDRTGEPPRDPADAATIHEPSPVDRISAEQEVVDDWAQPSDVFEGDCANGDCGEAFAEDESLGPPGGLTGPSPGGPPRGGPPPGVGGRGGMGGGGIGGFGGPPGKSVSYETLWVPNQPFAQQPTELGLVQHEFAVSWPLWTAGPQGVSFTGSVREVEYSTSARLPDGRRAFPDRLWGVRVGVGYFRMFSNGWMGMVNIGINSSSDEPFHSSREVAPFANAFLRMPTNDTDAWVFALVYSPNSQLPFPVPGAAYQMVASEQWRFSLGIPFSATYTPTPRWKFEVSYLPVVLVNARATWQFAESTSLYTGFGTNIDGYFLTDRVETREQFFSFDHRLMLGVQHNFAKGFSLDVSTGYIFHRFFYEGRGFSDQDQNRLDVGDGVYLMGRLQKRF